MATPNWGPYLAGEDTLAYYAQIAADTATQTTEFSRKISDPQQQSIFKAAAVSGITQVTINAATAHIPGYTSGATPA